MVFGADKARTSHTAEETFVSYKISCRVCCLYRIVSFEVWIKGTTPGKADALPKRVRLKNVNYHDFVDFL
jgi:hypothetical protein